MATNNQTSDADLGFVDRRRTYNVSSGTALGTPANYVSIANMDTRLTAISSTTFTAARLATMTDNDKRYALRLSDDPLSI